MENDEGGGGEYTKDGSVDLGGWTACIFLSVLTVHFRHQRDSESASGALSFLRPDGRRQCFAAGICFAWPWAMDLCYAYMHAVYELFERTAYYGVAANLTERLHQGTVQAANNVTNWSGTVFLTPLLGGHPRRRLPWPLLDLRRRLRRLPTGMYVIAN